MKSDDNTTKNWAYVNVCRFISVYETPPKIILQVYVALLRAYKTDRALVCKALDILVPALPKRLPKDDFVKAIKWTKKVIFEDSNVNQIVHVWGVFSRNPSMFYVHRDQFVPQMVNSLSKLALPQNASAEQRKLAVDLTEIIVVWETDRVVKDRTSKLKEKKRQMDNNSKEKKFAIKFKLSEKRKKINAKRKKLGKCKLEHKKPR